MNSNNKKGVFCVQWKFDLFIFLSSNPFKYITKPVSWQMQWNLNERYRFIRVNLLVDKGQLLSDSIYVKMAWKYMMLLSSKHDQS